VSAGAVEVREELHLIYCSMHEKHSPACSLRYMLECCHLSADLACALHTPLSFCFTSRMTMIFGSMAKARKRTS
jgi:hypothetical protein